MAPSRPSAAASRQNAARTKLLPMPRRWLSYLHARTSLARSLPLAVARSLSLCLPRILHLLPAPCHSLEPLQLWREQTRDDDWLARMGNCPRLPQVHPPHLRAYPRF